MEKKQKINHRLIIPAVTAIFALLFILIGFKDFGFWTNQPTAAFFPIIIAVVLLITSIACLIQLARDKGSSDVKYNRGELMVILGGAGVIIGTYLIGLVASCLVYLFIWLKFIEHSSWKVIIIIEALMAAIILGVFVTWLQGRFPLGLFQYIL